MYIHTETKDNKFQIFRINLDSDDPVVEGPNFEYSTQDLDGPNNEINAFHVRGSSAKEKINLNKDLICYMMHGTNLYAWTDNGNNVIEKVKVPRD